jgi:PadR family transcriptional regulator PadR
MSDANWQEQMRRGTVELAVLLAVASGPNYGLEIIRRLEFADLVLAEGTVYPLLARLERDGMLSAEWIDGDGPRPRKYYQLTPAGRTRMRRMAQTFRSIATGIERMAADVMGDLR